MKKFFKQKNKGRQALSEAKGYTIIETMIAVSVFLVVIMIGMGAILNANLLHQKSRDMRSIMDNLSFVMEDMGRNLRTGYNYRCYDSSRPWNQSYAQNGGSEDLNIPRSCVSGGVLVFEESHGRTPTNAVPDPDATDQWIYLLGTYNGNTGIFKSVTGGGTSGNPDWTKLTPDEVIVDMTNSQFTVIGAEPPEPVGTDHLQPFVTIRLVGTITFKPGTPNAVVTPFSLQTSISQRAIDI